MELLAAELSREVPQYQKKSLKYLSVLESPSSLESLRPPPRRPLRQEIEQCQFLAESFPLLSAQEERAVLAELRSARGDLIARIVNSPLAVKHMHFILANAAKKESTAKNY